MTDVRLDIEAIITEAVATAVEAVYPTVHITGEYTPTPPAFPCVFILELNNYTNSQDMSGDTTHRNVLFEIDVFSNLRNGKKEQCREIAAIADGVMNRYGFFCQDLRPVPNYADASIYRMTGTYRRVIAAGDSRF